MSKQNGFIRILVIILLLAGLAGAVYLIQQKTNFLPKAASRNNTTLGCSYKNIFGLNHTDNPKIQALLVKDTPAGIAVAWKDLQPTADSPLDFTKVDQSIAQVEANGQSPVLTICEGDCFPDWARNMEKPVESHYCCADPVYQKDVCRVLKEDNTSQTAFENIITGLANRYKDKVVYWDYGIEPNCRGYTPEYYTQLLKLFHDNVKSVIPNAIIIGGHLSGADPINYMRVMYDNGAKNYFDKFSIDPYGEDFGKTGQALSPILDEARNMMISEGDGDKKIWIGEWGVQTAGDEAQQAETIKKGLDYLSSNNWIEFAAYHNYECELYVSSCSQNTPGYLGFDLLRSDSTEKPSYQVFKDAIDACIAPPASATSPIPTPSTPIDSAPNIHSNYGIDCNKDVKLSTSLSGDKITFKIEGDASTFLQDDLGDGIKQETCTGEWNNKTCEIAEPGDYSWKHSWRHCVGSFNNCSPLCTIYSTYKTLVL